MKSLDQQRAAHAYSALDTAKLEEVDLCRRLPAMLRINGLLATWAFLVSKENKGTATPLKFLVRHLREVRALPSLEVEDPKDLFRHWVGIGPGVGDALSCSQLRDLSRETLAFAGWLKRAAEATKAAPQADTEGAPDSGAEDPALQGGQEADGA